VLMGQEDQVGLGEGVIIGQIAVGIHMGHLSPKIEHQRAVADEGDLQVTRPCLDDICLEFLPGEGRNCHDHKEQIA